MWISRVSQADAVGRLRALYDRIKGPDGHVDNIMQAHSLRPHTMEGHLALYKHVLHHSANTTPKWLLETIGVQVSLLNGCRYCVDHHYAGLKRLLGDPVKALMIRTGIENGDLSATGLSMAEQAALAYAAILTLSPMAEDALLAAVEAMRSTGWDDGGILEVNQVTAYFAYANRTVLGLGVNTEGDTLGLSPGNAEDPEDWAHR